MKFLGIFINILLIKGQKVVSQSAAHTDFKKIFKAVWEESLTLTDEKGQVIFPEFSKKKSKIPTIFL